MCLIHAAGEYAADCMRDTCYEENKVHLRSATYFKFLHDDEHTEQFTDFMPQLAGRAPLNICRVESMQYSGHWCLEKIVDAGVVPLILCQRPNPAIKKNHVEPIGSQMEVAAAVETAPYLRASSGVAVAAGTIEEHAYA